MFCHKSVNIIEEYGVNRLIFLSMLACLSFFIFYFLIFRTFIYQSTLHDHGFLVFIAAMYLIIPIHSLFHYIPLLMVTKEVAIKVKFHKGIPIVLGKLTNPINKPLAVVVLVFPTVVITLLATISSILFPHLLLYFAFTAAVNIGLFIYDFIPLSQVLNAPKDSYLQLYNGGFRILRQQRS